MGRRLAALTLLAFVWLLVGGRGEASPHLRGVLAMTGDFDGDGLEDDIVAARQGLSVRLSHVHHRRVLLPAGTDLVGMAVGDIDRDGDPDLVALRGTGQLLVWRNQSGHFTRVAPEEGTRGLTPGGPQFADVTKTAPPEAIDASKRRGGPSGGLPRSFDDFVLPVSASLPFLPPTSLRSALSAGRLTPRAPPSLAVACIA